VTTELILSSNAKNRGVVMRLTDMTFRKKILMILIVPLMGFLWSSVSAIITSVKTYNDMLELKELIQLSSTYSDVVHELQKERGLTAGVIASKRSQFVEQLRVQRKITKHAMLVRKDYWLANTFKHENIRSLHRAMNTQLTQLKKIRVGVDKQTISLKDALAYYTETNTKLLKISTVIFNNSRHALLTKETGAYYSFIQGKEQAGIERAVLNNIFVKGTASANMFVKALALASEQETYFKQFNAFANEANKRFYQQSMAHPSINEVKELREIAYGQIGAGTVTVEPLHWFTQATERIGQLKSIEDNLSRELLLLAKSIESDSFNEMIFNLLISLFIMITAIVLSVYITKILNTEVKDLMHIMQKVRDENDLTVRAKYTGKGELGQIANALNLILEKVAAAIEEMASSSNILAASAEETSQTCLQSSSALTEQKNEITLIATAIEELTITVKGVASNTQLAADSAKYADKQAKVARVVVQDSYHSIEQLAAEVTLLAKRIHSLHSSSNNITNIVHVIKSIAEQTNLLALNAAIEAARAGEQGRGFAVVADEVRTLAQRTQESTSEIESLISSLQSDSNSAFSVIEQSQKMAAEAVTQSKNVEQTLLSITDSVSNIFSVTGQVAIAVEEQALVTNSVAENVVNVELKSTETTVGATQITATANEQAELAANLQGISSHFKI